MVLFEGQQPCDPNRPGDEKESKVWGGLLNEVVTISLAEHADIVTFDVDPYADDGSLGDTELPQITGDEAVLYLRDKTKDPENKNRKDQLVLDIYIKTRAVKGADDKNPIIRVSPDENDADPLAEITMERVNITGGIETVEEASVYTIEPDLELKRLDIPLHDGVPNYLRLTLVSPQALNLDIEHFNRIEKLRESGRSETIVGAEEAAMVAGLLAVSRDPRDFEPKENPEE